MKMGEHQLQFAEDVQKHLSIAKKVRDRVGEGMVYCNRVPQ